MEAEIQALNSKGTYSWVKRKPGMRPIPCKWVFKWKAHEARAKSRIVVLGNLQDTSGMDVFASTAAHTAVKTIFFKAALMGWTIETLDIDAAFLNGKAPPNTYVLPPPGYETDGYLWKLNKSLYGMATSPKAWFEHFTATLSKFGLEQSRIEPCLFTQEDLTILVYVDDVLFTGTQRAMGKFKVFLKGEYSLKLPGKAERCENSKSVWTRTVFGQTAEAGR